MSMIAASKRYKIPFGTLNNKFNGKHGKTVGEQTMFTEMEENATLNAALQCVDWGFPLDLLEIRMLAKKYLVRGRVIEKFATGIYPFNRFKVLDKIPDIQHDPTQQINSSLTELLREKRYGNNPERQRRKKTRLEVVPGRSVATRDSSSEDEEGIEESLTNKSGSLERNRRSRVRYT